MKAHSIFIICILFVGISSLKAQQELKGIMMSVGPTLTSNTVYSNCSAIGQGNSLYASYSQAIGTSNAVYSGGCSLVVGSSNTAVVSNCLVVGTSNSSQYAGGGTPGNNLVLGEFNLGFSRNSIICGSNSNLSAYSSVPGGTQNQYPNSTALLGKGLISRNDNCLVVGKNNDGITRITDPLLAPLFVVGNGDSASNRKNALEVTADGNMKVQGVITCARGGDIPMFGE